MSLERVSNDKRQELDLRVGTILVNQLEHIVEVLVKFEPGLQPRSRMTPGNKESFAMCGSPTSRSPTPKEENSLPACTP